MQCSSGNLSCRADAEHVLISASRSWLADLTPAQVVIMRLADGAVLNGLTPSVESRFHLGILRARPEIDVVLHFQPPHAVALACQEQQGIDYNVVPEIPYYIGPIGHVPYLEPGTPELADAVIATMRTHNLCVLRNHGHVTVGKTFHQAIQNAVFFEMACGIIVRSGARLQPLAPAAAERMRQASKV
jgi:ribulose-5-phosphate 4-epimerase/fuculose-1-phosphate aldolase